MELFTWNDNCSVNIAEIDVQHRHLIDTVNELNSGLNGGLARADLQKIFARLLEYASYHFAIEEKLMSQHDFPGFDQHKAEHDEFRRKIASFLDAFLESEQDIVMEMVHFLFSWVKLHVLFTDKKYSAFLNERGVY